MALKEKDRIRTENFLRIVRERYGDSGAQFERETGYSAIMVSQIKTGKKFVGEDRAAKLEEHMGLKPGTLDLPSGGDSAPALPSSSAPRWPFSVPFRTYDALSPQKRREIDATLTRLVLGAQAEELLDQQQSKVKR